MNTSNTRADAYTKPATVTASPRATDVWGDEIIRNAAWAYGSARASERRAARVAHKRSQSLSLRLMYRIFGV